MLCLDPSERPPPCLASVPLGLSLPPSLPLQVRCKVGRRPSQVYLSAWETSWTLILELPDNCFLFPLAYPARLPWALVWHRPSLPSEGSLKGQWCACCQRGQSHSHGLGVPGCICLRASRWMIATWNATRGQGHEIRERKNPRDCVKARERARAEQVGRNVARVFVELIKSFRWRFNY